jgi:hypothetical protein
VISKAVPGADQAVITGTRSTQLSAMPETAAPIEMPQTQEAKVALSTWAACAAW